jgi:hypothetical protein
MHPRQSADTDPGNVTGINTILAQFLREVKE